MKILDCTELKQLIAVQPVTLVDIRDLASYNHSHVNNALHLNEANFAEFVADNSKETPIVVYCYRGVSSISTAQYLESLGFNTVYSLQGGYNEWLENLESLSV